MTGYHEPPAGVEVKEGLHYNPYFNGSWIAMAKALYDDIIEYSDGTPATLSQLSKDVTEFLRWSAEKSHDEKKKLLLKVSASLEKLKFQFLIDKKQFFHFSFLFQVFLVFPPILALFYVYKRRVFTVMKSRKLVYNPTKSNGKSGH